MFLPLPAQKPSVCFKQIEEQNDWHHCQKMEALRYRLYSTGKFVIISISESQLNILADRDRRVFFHGFNKVRIKPVEWKWRTAQEGNKERPSK